MRLRPFLVGVYCRFYSLDYRIAFGMVFSGGKYAPNNDQVIRLVLLIKPNIYQKKSLLLH